MSTSSGTKFISRPCGPLSWSSACTMRHLVIQECNMWNIQWKSAVEMKWQWIKLKQLSLNCGFLYGFPQWNVCLGMGYIEQKGSYVLVGTKWSSTGSSFSHNNHPEINYCMNDLWLANRCSRSCTLNMLPTILVGQTLPPVGVWPKARRDNGEWG